MKFKRLDTAQSCAEYRSADNVSLELELRLFARCRYDSGDACYQPENTPQLIHVANLDHELHGRIQVAAMGAGSDDINFFAR